MDRNKKKPVSRRAILGIAGSAAALGAASVLAGEAAAGAIGGTLAEGTPPQTEGPFFPLDTSSESDADLTRLGQSPLLASGKRVRINGLVLDEHGQPLEGAVVTLWQACATGKYNHPSDPNTAELDPHFQYWAGLKTTKDGRFSALTIEPGAYPATADWDRPPHVHFRVEHEGVTLTTQMYFKGHPLNAADSLLQQTRRNYGDEAADSLVVDFKQTAGGGLTSELEGEFVIRLGTTVALD